MRRPLLLAFVFCAAASSGCDRDSGQKELPRLARQQTDTPEGAFRNLGKRAASSIDAAPDRAEPVSR